MKIILKWVCFIIEVLLLSACEGKMIYFVPNEPEKLFASVVIDADDTFRQIDLKKSYQPEYPAEEKDSLRELSITISYRDSNLFKFDENRSMRNDITLIIPDSIKFETDKRYILKAKEKSIMEISSESIVPPLPPNFVVNSMEKVVYINDSYPIWANPAMKAKINITIEKNKIDKSYFTLLVEVINKYSPKYITYNVLKSEIPFFITGIPNFRTSHEPMNGIGLSRSMDPCPVAFFEVGSLSELNISISIEMGGNEVYDYKKPIKVRLVSIPKELYNFEKSIYTYSNRWRDPFSEPVYLDSNIENGYGIFAICRSKEVTVSLPWQ